MFDNDAVPELSAEFLQDDRHHLVVALEDELVVGFASRVYYVHPDKPPELWINEIGVAPSHQGCGDAPEETVMFTFRLDPGGRPALGSEGDQHGRAD